MTSAILLAIAAVLYLGPRLAPKVIQWAKSDGTSFAELLIAEATALETLKRRAERRGAEDLSKACEDCENAFMSGEEPRK